MSSAIVRYGAGYAGKRAIGSLIRYNKRMRVGPAAYKQVYSLAGRVAARRIGRWWRSRRGRYRRSKIMRRTAPSTRRQGTTKQDPPSTTLTQLAMGNLYVADFPWPGSSGSNDDITRRERNTVSVSGLKICRIFEYTQDIDDAAQQGPVEVHWCLLQLKTDQTNLDLSADLPIEFFRDNSRTTTRARDFNPYDGTDQWDMGKNCLQINPNKWVRVLTHKRFHLQPFAPGAAYRPWMNIKKINKYYRLKKNITYNNVLTNLPNQRIFECYWYNTTTPTKFQTNNSDATLVGTTRMNTVYFRDR